MHTPTKAYMFLPKVKIVSKNILIQKMNKSIEENNENEQIKTYQRNLMRAISYKLLSEEWNMEDYYSFVKAISQNINKCYPEISLPLIIHLFNYDEGYLKETLEKLEKEPQNEIQQLYPYYNLAQVGNKQVSQKNPYNKMDAYQLVGTIIAKIHSLATEEVRKLFAQDNRELTLEMLKELSTGQRDATNVLKKFDDNFAFLRELEPYKGLYYYYKEQYLKMLEKDFANRYRLEQTSLVKREIDHNACEIRLVRAHKLPRVGGYFKYIKEK